MITIFTRRPKRRPFFPMNGALTGFNYNSSAWTVSSGRALCTPALGAELFANGTFAADTNWTKGTGWAISGGVATHSGATGGLITQAVGTADLWHRIDWTLAYTSGTFQSYFGDTTNGQGVAEARTASGTFTDTMQQKSTTAIGVRAVTTAEGSIDNVSGKTLTTNTLFATQNKSSQFVTCTAKASIVTGNHAGIVTNLDSVSNPQNYILVTHNGVRVVCRKVVAGVYTVLFQAVASYVENAPLKVITTNSGGNILVNVTYNGTTVGTQQTVTDAGIVSNTRHGIFSTYSGNTFSNFTVV